VFRAAIVVFTIGSVLCGRADTLPFLVGARILQGVGGAMMVPVGRLLLLRTVAKSELVAAMAWLSMPALIGPVVGPPLGGFLVTYLSWRWIFDINVPIGVLGVVLVTLFIKDVREPVTNRFDPLGLALSAVGLASVMFGPLLDFTLMRIPTFMVSVVAGTLFRIGIGAIPFLLPLMLQLGFGRSAAQSGLITFASSAGAVVMKPAAMSALRRLGFRDTLVWNAALSSVLLALCAAFRPSWPMLAIYAALLFGGFFRSLQFTAYNTLAYADIPRARMSAATSLYSTIQQVSLTLGVTIGAACLEITMAGSGSAVPSLGDFSIAFVAVAFVSFLAAPVALLMPRGAGDELSGHVAAR
jgi:MFS family permease